MWELFVLLEPCSHRGTYSYIVAFFQGPILVLNNTKRSVVSFVEYTPENVPKIKLAVGITLTYYVTVPMLSTAEGLCSAYL